MRPGPRNPGESVADYNTRIKAMEAKWKAGMGGPKGGGTKAAPGSRPRGMSSADPGSRPRGTSPIPPKPPTPVKPTVTPPRPISPKGGTRVVDTRPPGYPKNPVRSGETKTQYLDRVRSEKGGSSGGKGGPRGMKSGGMVKGKK